MGMFDEVRCLHALPCMKPEAVVGIWFQTKSFDDPALDHLEIREDGTLWREKCDARFEENKDAPLGFYIYQENCRWAPEPLTGELEFYHYESDQDQSEFLALFNNGKLVGEVLCKLCVGPMALDVNPPNEPGKKLEFGPTDGLAKDEV